MDEVVGRAVGRFEGGVGDGEEVIVVPVYEADAGAGFFLDGGEIDAPGSTEAERVWGHADAGSDLGRMSVSEYWDAPFKVTWVFCFERRK